MDDGTKKVLMIGVPVGIGLLAVVAYFASSSQAAGPYPPPNGNGQPPPVPLTDYIVVGPLGGQFTNVTYYHQRLGEVTGSPVSNQHIRNSITELYNYENINEAQWSSGMDQVTALGL